MSGCDRGRKRLYGSHYMSKKLLVNYKELYQKTAEVLEPLSQITPDVKVGT
jgi:hypothetical protein